MTVIVHCDRCKAPLYALDGDGDGFPKVVCDPLTDGKGPPVVARLEPGALMRVFCNGACAAAYIRDVLRASPCTLELKGHLAFNFDSSEDAAKWIEHQAFSDLTGGFPLNRLAQWAR